MKSSKFLIASIVVLACAVGIFIGAVFIGGGPGMGPKCPPRIDMPMPKPAPDMGKKQPQMPPPDIDSILQITSEQKGKIVAQRERQDSLFKVLRKQKHEAEVALREALEAGTIDTKKVEDAKSKLLDAQKALVELRIEGVSELSKILTKEQFAQFQKFGLHKDKGKGKKHHKGGKEFGGPEGFAPEGMPGELGPKPGKGPEGAPFGGAPKGKAPQGGPQFGEGPEGFGGPQGAPGEFGPKPGEGPEGKGGPQGGPKPGAGGPQGAPQGMPQGAPPQGAPNGELPPPPPAN